MSISDLLNPAVGLYLFGIVLGQWLVFRRRKQQEIQQSEARRNAKLTGKPLLDRSVQLQRFNQQSLHETGVLLGTVCVLPFVIAGLFHRFELDIGGLPVAFLGLMGWFLFSATDIAKAFFGGVAFRSYASIRCPFQVGDRVTIGGQSGKVEFIGPFFVTLVTVDDDLVNVPTASLWNQTLISANAGDKSSLAVMSFHLAPFVSADLRRKTEQNIWDAIQKSMYWDHEKPMQIYLEQNKDEIVLTAKAYVASTYNEALFKSDVYQSFLDFVDQEQIPLASTEWHRELK